MASSGYPGMERWKGRVAIVTGASSGIGYELSKRLVQLGVVVVGCGISITAIEVRKARHGMVVRRATQEAGAPHLSIRQFVKNRKLYYYLLLYNTE